MATSPLDCNARGKITITQFLEKYVVEKLCILGTKTATDDFRSAADLPKTVNCITQVDCLFNNPQNIIDGIKKASELKYIEGIMVTRGGSKHSSDMRAMLLPFYSIYLHFDHF